MAGQKMQLVDWFDDLCVRFIINLPQEELESVARICFQVEEAQWFYEDFVRPMDPTLPSMNLKQFCLRIFKHCPLLSAFSDEQHLLAYQEFLGYKTRVPVRGAIMLNEAMDRVLLVKGWKSSASWSFPRGKINKDEKDLDCAVREVYEETGYDIQAAGLVPDENTVKAIDVTMREQHMRLFVFRGVPEDTFFEPKTRKEISKISWYKLHDLPTLRKGKHSAHDGQEQINANKFYMVAPFLGPLKKWITQQRKIDSQNALLGEYTEGDDPGSEAYIEEQATQLPELSETQLGQHDMLDPASQLKKLLSVSGPAQAVSQAQAGHQQQAASLLAMLRGGAPQHHMMDPTQLPHTPLDQIAGFPQQPAPPHYSHHQQSSHVGARAPPHMSPQYLEPQMASMNLQAIPTPHAGPHQQTGQYFPQEPLTTQFPALQSNFDGQRGHPPPSHPPDMRSPSQAHMLASPSQLPPPRLNNHEQGLLDAFRNGIARSQDAHGSSQQSTIRDNPAAQNTQQTSLLDLFKSTSVASIPAPVMPQGAIKQTATIPATPVVAAPLVRNLPAVTSVAPSAARKPSAMSMITRTLPKAKKVPPPPAPIIDNENYPILGSRPIEKRPSAKMVAAAMAAVEATPALRPTKILSRPAVSLDATPVAPRSNSRPVSRGKRTPATVTSSPKVTILQRPRDTVPAVQGLAVANENAPFKPQILKRGDPQPLQQGPLSPRAPPQPSDQAGMSQKDTLLSLFAQSQQAALQHPLQSLPLFQPSNVEAFARQTTSPVRPGFYPHQLAPRTASQASIHGAIGGERSGSRSGSIASPTAAIGPRLGSFSSFAGLTSPTHSGILQAQIADAGVGGGGAAGARSASRHGSLAGSIAGPSTPVEARGFLMDYLDGVVKGGK